MKSLAVRMQLAERHAAKSATNDRSHHSIGPHVRIVTAAKLDGRTPTNAV
jgi:hypothetical protein